MSDIYKKRAVMRHESCIVWVGDVAGEPRERITTYTSNIGVVTQTVVWPHPVGHAKQGWQDVAEVLSDYTGPDFDEYGEEI